MSLMNILKEYYDHHFENPNTLTPRFFGLHHIRVDNVKVRFVIMQNVFYSHVELHEKYDLKGSTVGRGLTEEEKRKKGVRKG